MSAVSRTVEVLVRCNLRRATSYLDEKTVVTAAARLRPRPGKRPSSFELVLKLGAPNFVERRFIRIAKKAGEPFPIKKIQIKKWPKK